MRYKKVLIIIIIVITSSIVLNIKINNSKEISNQENGNQNVGIETPEKSDPFDPDPPGIYFGKYWNFTTGEIVGWRVTSDWGVRDKIFNISDLKYFSEEENVTRREYPPGAYYGVQLTPAYWNISTSQVEEFTNRTVFPLLNASLINYTLPEVDGMKQFNMEPFAFMNEDGGPEFFLNLFVPRNTTNDLLDIFWVADALHWYYSIWLNGNFHPVEGYPMPPENPSELCDLTVTSNSIEYSNPSKGTYSNLYYYDNGTLQTGEIKLLVMPQMTITINWTRIFDFNPLDDLKWSTHFDTKGEEIFVGLDTNETKLVFNHTVDNMELTIKWEEEDEEWDVELLYYQEIWANVSYWNDENKEWIYINTTAVSSANEVYPIVFVDDDDNGDDDHEVLPPILLIPDQGTALGVKDLFKIWELNPEWTDIKIEGEENWVKITNTTSSNIVVFSYQTDGILEYIYMQNIGPFGGMGDDPYDEDIMFYYKNHTSIPSIKPSINTFTIYSFDLDISAVVNISVEQASWVYLSGFPYNPTNHSIGNALGFFDIFIEDQTDLNQDNFAPINITFNYDHKTYKSINVFWFNISADNHKGAWEEIKTIKDLGNGVIVVTLNHTSIIVFTASIIPTFVPATGDDDDDDDDEAPAVISYGSYYLLFIGIAAIGLIIYTRRKLINHKI